MRYSISISGVVIVEPSLIKAGKMYQAKYKGKIYTVSLEKDGFNRDIIHILC